MYLVTYFVADEAYREGDIRLVGGFYNWEGRVEIYWSGTWGAISDSSWTAAEANVVCRQLRHLDYGNYFSILCHSHIVSYWYDQLSNNVMSQLCYSMSYSEQ